MASQGVEMEQWERGCDSSRDVGGKKEVIDPESFRGPDPVTESFPALVPIGLGPTRPGGKKMHRIYGV